MRYCLVQTRDIEVYSRLGTIAAPTAGRFLLQPFLSHISL